MLTSGLICLFDVQIWAADIHIHVKPLSETVCDPVGRDSIHTEMTITKDDWLRLLEERNPELAKDITARALATITVRDESIKGAADSMPAFVRAAEKEAAHWGANQLFLEDTAVEEKFEEIAEVTFVAVRIQYKDWVIPPTFLAGLPYNPVSEEFVAQKLEEWNVAHLGKVKVTFSSRDQQDVLVFMAQVKNGTPLRLVLKNGTDVRGDYSGLDQDDQIWIRPSGFGGFLSHRSFRSKDVETVGILD